MGRWLAEFQENTPETGISCTDITDRSHDVSVMSVPNQGILEEKSIETKLMERVSDACAGLDITPIQFITLLTNVDKDDILSGNTQGVCLRAYAKSFNEGIKSGRIKFYPSTWRLIKHRVLIYDQDRTNE